MTDRLTDADLDAIEQRLTEGRIVNVVAQRALFAEVCRLRAMETRVTMLAASCDPSRPRCEPVGNSDRSTECPTGRVSRSRLSSSSG